MTSEQVTEQVKGFKLFRPKIINATSAINISETFKTKLTSETKLFKNKSDFVEKVGEPHPFDYTVVESVAKKFGLVSAIIDKISDFTIGPKLMIDSKDDKIVDTLEKWMSDTRFRAHLRPWFKESLRKGAGYLEVAGLTEFDELDMVKVVNSNTIFKKRDEFGVTIGYNQFLGDNLNKIDENDIIELNKDEIIQLDINKMGTDPYGMGIIFSALRTLNDFLSAQKSMHHLMKRKANSPIHVQMGDSEKDIIPTQEDVNKFGKDLQFMNECTEWVTDDTIKMTVLDFGNIGDKFSEILNNDYKLLSYSFQVPEIILGAAQGGGLSDGGKANIQMEAFERNIQSYQEQIAFTIMTKIFNRVLLNAGVTNLDYNIVWGQQSQDDKNSLITTYTALLSVQGLSAGLRKEIERKISVLDDIDFEDIEKENEKDMRRKNREQKQMFNQQQQLVDTKNKKEEKLRHDIFHEILKGNAPQEIESKFSKYDKEGFNVYKIVEEESEELTKDYDLDDWVGEFVQIKQNILKIISSDVFENLKAKTSSDVKLGMLNKTQIEKLRNIMTNAFETREGLNSIANKINKIGLKDRFIMQNGKKILSISKENRAFMLARTETVRLRALGSLDRFSEKGDTKARFTLVSARPCSQCIALDGTIFSLTEASGIIPVHGMCRCIWEQV